MGDTHDLFYRYTEVDKVNQQLAELRRRIANLEAKLAELKKRPID